jgi:MFS family permease
MIDSPLTKHNQAAIKGVNAMKLERKPLHYGWVVLVAGSLGVFSALGLARFGYTLLLEPMQKAFSLSNEQTGLIASMNLVGYVLLSFIGGILASRFGARLVASVGLAIIALGLVGTGLANDFLTIVITRGITGIGSGITYSAIMGLWASWFSKERRGMATGIAVTGPSISLIIMGITLPKLMAAFETDGWRYAWFILGGLAVIITTFALIAIRNRPADGIAIGHVPGTPLAPKENVGFVAGIKMVYTQGFIWKLGLVYAASGFSYIIFMTFFSKHMITSGLIDQAGAGQLFSVMGGVSLVCGYWGAISDRLGRKPTIAILFGIHTLAFGLFAIQSVPTFIIATVLYGLSSGSIPAVAAALCGDTQTPKNTPVAIGLITLCFGIGQALGPVVAGRMADVFNSFSPSLILAAAVALLGGFGALLLKVPHKSEVKSN